MRVDGGAVRSRPVRNDRTVGSARLEQAPRRDRQPRDVNGQRRVGPAALSDRRQSDLKEVDARGEDREGARGDARAHGALETPRAAYKDWLKPLQ